MEMEMEVEVAMAGRNRNRLICGAWELGAGSWEPEGGRGSWLPEGRRPERYQPGPLFFFQIRSPGHLDTVQLARESRGERGTWNCTVPEPEVPALVPL